MNQIHLVSTAEFEKCASESVSSTSMKISRAAFRGDVV